MFGGEDALGLDCLPARCLSLHLLSCIAGVSDGPGSRCTILRHEVPRYPELYILPTNTYIDIPVRMGYGVFASLMRCSQSVCDCPAGGTRFPVSRNACQLCQSPREPCAVGSDSTFFLSGKRITDDMWVDVQVHEMQSEAR